MNIRFATSDRIRANLTTRIIKKDTSLSPPPKIKKELYRGEGPMRIHAGMYADAETGLYYNWYRYYDPKIGRYIQFDPVGIVRSIGQAQMPTLPKELKRQLNVPWPEEVIESGLNQPYAYVDNNPLRWTDPSGLSSGILGCRILGCDRRSVADEICRFAAEKAGACWYSCSDGIYLGPPKGGSCPPTCRPTIRKSEGLWVGNWDWLDGLRP